MFTAPFFSALTSLDPMAVLIGVGLMFLAPKVAPIVLPFLDRLRQPAPAPTPVPAPGPNPAPTPTPAPAPSGTPVIDALLDLLKQFLARQQPGANPDTLLARHLAGQVAATIPAEPAK